MAVIDSVVEVDITASAATPSIPGTEIPALAGYHTYFTDLVRTYSDPSGMTADGFTDTEPLMLMALSLCEQDPRPAQFKIIRLTGDYQQIMHFNVTDTQAGHVDGFVLTLPDGSTFNFQHLVTAGQTAAQIATALAALTQAGLTIAVDGSVNTQVNLTVTAHHDLWFPSAITGGDFIDVTVAPTGGTLGADLDAAVLADSDFYGIASTLLSAAAIAAVATWAEANKRWHGYTTADTNNVNTNNLGIFQTLENESLDFSYGQFTGTPASYPGVAAMGILLVEDAGSFALAYKELEGVPADGLSANQITNAGQLTDVATKNGNVYINFASTNNILDGRMASGMYADIRIGIDGLTRDMQISVFSLLRRLPKVPYTRKGVSMIGAEMAASLARYVQQGFLSDDAGDEPQVLPPIFTLIAPSDKSARKLKQMKFTAIAQGAIQRVQIQGTINF